MVGCTPIALFYDLWTNLICVSVNEAYPSANCSGDIVGNVVSPRKRFLAKLGLAWQKSL